MAKMYVNIVHRTDAGPAARESLRFQLDEAHRFGLKSTTLISYQGMNDPEAIALIRDARDRHGDEIGIALHDMTCKDLFERFGTREGMFYLMPRKTKAAILAYMFERFHSLFGFQPTSIAHYVMDAWTLRHLKQHHPTVKVAITNCFEEGVKMFQGNNHNWYLFNDGGPWGPFLPAKPSALCPAKDADEDVGIVALPHLNRDMILALTSRDDLFASHPLNLYRAVITDGRQCPYNFQFIDQWIEQAKLNGWSYYNIFVSTSWVTPGFLFTRNTADARGLYSDTLQYLRAKQDQGLVQTATMSEFADTFRQLTRPGDPQACHWRNLIGSPKREMFWFVNAHYRVAVDLNRGGSIVDLRAYPGRINRDLGSDTKSLWNGSYPYLMSAEMHGYPGNAGMLCDVRIGDARAGVDARRTRGTSRREGDTWILQLDPIKLDVGQYQVTLATTMRFDATGGIHIERKVLDTTAPDGQVTLTERAAGLWGTVDYPEDLRGISLVAEGGEGAGEIPVEYSAATRTVSAPTRVAALIPQVGCRLALEPDGAADAGEISDCTVFHPYYALSLRKTVRKGGSLKTWLRIEKL